MGEGARKALSHVFIADQTGRARCCANQSATHDYLEPLSLNPPKAVRAAARKPQATTAGASAILAAECRCAESASPSQEEAARSWLDRAEDCRDSLPRNFG